MLLLNILTVREALGHSAPLRVCDWLWGEVLYLSACFYLQVKVWDCNTGKCIETLTVRPVAVVPKGTAEGLPGGWGQAGLTSPEPMTCFWQGVLDVAHACVFTPDGKLLVSGAAD